MGFDFKNVVHNTGSAHWLYLFQEQLEAMAFRSATEACATCRYTVRNNNILSILRNFDETNAFVDGLVPYGDIPNKYTK